MKCAQLSELYLFDFSDVPDEGGVVDEVLQLLQLAEVLHVILPDDLKETFKVLHLASCIYMTVC